MTMIKRALTEVAVDAFTDYLKEKLEKVKQLDLDQDGTKDVDQLAEIVARLGLHFKDALTTTNFSQIATGLDQIIAGVELVRNSLDKEKLGALTKEVSLGLTKIGELTRLSIQYVKEHPQN